MYKYSSLYQFDSTKRLSELVQQFVDYDSYKKVINATGKFNLSNHSSEMTYTQLL